VHVWIALKMKVDASEFFVCVHALFTGLASIFLIKTTLKLDSMTLFTYLKIILLQYFQFSTINGIQTDP